MPNGHKGVLEYTLLYVGATAHNFSPLTTWTVEYDSYSLPPLRVLPFLTIKPSFAS
jgi:hypothetical protein